MNLSSYLLAIVNTLRLKPRTKDEIWNDSRTAARDMNLEPPQYRYDTPVPVFLYFQIYKNQLNLDMEEIKSLKLAAAEDLWYKPIIDFANPSKQADLSCISMPMVYRVNPSAPVSCVLLICDRDDDIDSFFDNVLRVVSNGFGVGIEMLSTSPDLIEKMVELDRRLVETSGKRENFISINVLACHPDADELLSRCNKSGGLFFMKINIGFWWSPKFYYIKNNGDPFIPIIEDRNVDLSMIKKNPSLCRNYIGKKEYSLARIINMKSRGGIPYLLHIEACPGYENTIIASNLCTEISLPVRDDSSGSPRKMTQLCILGNVNVAGITKLDESERRQVYNTVVDLVSSVWDRIDVSSELKEICSGLPPIDYESRPCGIGMTGFFSAACDRGVKYNLDFVRPILAEFIDECTRRFESKQRVPRVKFSIPPSSNSELNMLSSPNIMHWPSSDVIVITSNFNFILHNDRHRYEELSYNDKVAISSMLDQSLSLDHNIVNVDSFNDMIKYMLHGYAIVDGERKQTKTISYYTRANVNRKNKKPRGVCTDSCDL